MKLDVEDGNSPSSPHVPISEIFAAMSAAPAPTGPAQSMSQFLASGLPWVIQCVSNLSVPGASFTPDASEPYEPDAVSSGSAP